MLAHQIVTAGSWPTCRTAVWLHGVLGRGRNWRSVARSLVEELPEWRLVLVDLRGHGESPPGDAPHTLAACAGDLVTLTEAIGEADLVVGHSLGGKVALAFAELAGVPRAIVLDSAPGPVVLDDDSLVPRVLKALSATTTPSPDRRSIREQLRALHIPEQVAAWLITGLVRRADGWYWGWDRTLVEELLADYARADLWPVVESGACDILFVRAGLSTRWTPEVLARLDDSPSTVACLEEAGHWLHVDDPSGLHAHLCRFFRQQ